MIATHVHGKSGSIIKILNIVAYEFIILIIGIEYRNRIYYTNYRNRI